MRRGPVIKRAGQTPQNLSEPSPQKRSVAVDQPPHLQAANPSSNGIIGIPKDVVVLLTKTVELVTRVVLRRSGLRRVQWEDLVNESLVLLLDERREATFWNALRAEAAGSIESTEARRAIIRAVDRALWRLSDLRKATADTTEPILDHGGEGTCRASRKRVLVPKHQGFADEHAIVDPNGPDFEQVDRCIDVWNALQGLKSRQRRALISRVVHRHTWTTIARKLHSSNKHIQLTVRQAASDLSRALRSYETTGSRTAQTFDGRL